MLLKYAHILKYIPIVHIIYSLRFSFLLLRGWIEYEDYYKANIKVTIFALPLGLFAYIVVRHFPNITFINPAFLMLPSVLLIVYTFFLICANVFLRTERES